MYVYVKMWIHFWKNIVTLKYIINKIECIIKSRKIYFYIAPTAIEAVNHKIDGVKLSQIKNSATFNQKSKYEI